MSSSIPQLTRTINSALWSAYGDALGFITELRDNERAIYSRIGSQRVIRTVAWKRRVGGKFGVEAALPSGCYSDDTQLRLATSRAIRPDSSFNVEAFAKMELPVWTAYALGGGRGTKFAATALGREGVSWFSNFYESESAKYVEGGGNGAAMRIQPHIWSAKRGSTFAQLAAPILRNAVCTHGHARAIVGAVFHAMCLERAMRFEIIPRAELWRDIIHDMRDLAEVLESDVDLKTFWLPVWEQKSGITFRDACSAVRQELIHDLVSLETLTSSKSKEENYRAGIRIIGGFDEQKRGSGTKTALLAVFLADLFREESPEDALICAANCLSSDTDTIATMTGAIMGSVSSSGPLGDLMDREYIIAQAERLAKISMDEPVEYVAYPNLLKWKPPRTQQDSVVLDNNKLHVLVLGTVVQEGFKFEVRRNDPSLWQWLKLESGQSILAKRKMKPELMCDYQKAFVEFKQASKFASEKSGQVQLALPGSVSSGKASTLPGVAVAPQSANINDLTKLAIQSKFDAKTIGEHILMLSMLPDGIERTIAYSAIIAKALLARIKNNF